MAMRNWSTNLMGNFLDTIKCPDVVQCVYGGRQTSMKTKYL